jgi:hypothetical protein
MESSRNGSSVGGRGVCNLAHADPSDPHSIFLSRNDYQGFLLNEPTAQALFQPAQVGLVHLNFAAQ